MKKNGIARPILVVGGLIAAAAACGSSESKTKCIPGSSVACTGSGGCAGGQTCNSDGASFGSCICGAGAAGSSGAGAAGSSGGPSRLCSPCWPRLACLAGGPVSGTMLVYLDGTKNMDGSCTLTQSDPDGGVFTVMILECGGATNQRSSWTYSTVPGSADSSLQLQFEAGSVYGDDGSIVFDAALSCEAT
jgi:hypothetical protein